MDNPFKGLNGNKREKHLDGTDLDIFNADLKASGKGIFKDREQRRVF